MNIKQLIESKNISKINEHIKNGHLFLVQNKLLSKTDYDSYVKAKDQEDYYDMLQGQKKLFLNSQYGATLSPYCRFFDSRLGASTTGTGRQIAIEMSNFITESINGSDQYKIKKFTSYDKNNEVSNEYTIDCPSDAGVIYKDTDSVAPNSLIEINGKYLEIEKHFDILSKTQILKKSGKKEFLYLDNHKTDIVCNNNIKSKYIKCIYRHKVSKDLYTTSTSTGKSIVTTEDHSIMIKRNDKLIEAKPTEILKSDLLIENNFGIIVNSKIKSVTKLKYEGDIWVYDIVMQDKEFPFFIANGILVHNSSFFSLDKLAQSVEEKDRKALVVEIADQLTESVNDNFVSFMKNAFNCQDEFSNIIKANREVVSSATILRAKKKYVMNVVNLEGVDIDENNPKSIKTMGSDIKLKSTPKPIREFLKKVTLDVLRNKNRSDIEDYVIDFRKKISDNKDYDPLEFASVSSVNEYDTYYMRYLVNEKRTNGKANLPGNARASINHNEMLEYFNDKETPPLRNGSKIKIVWLKPNQFNLVSIAFSTDQVSVPVWFKENFEIDLKATEQKMISQKIGNIFEPIGWEIPTEQSKLNKKLMEF